MEKMKLVSLSKSPYRSEYIFRKEQFLFEFIRNFSVDLGLKDNLWVKSIGRPIDKETDQTVQIT